MNVEQKQDDLKEEAVEEHIPGDEEEPGSETLPEEIDWRLEAEKNLDRFLRTQADMENMKKRLDREKADFVKFANEGLLRDLLPVLDNLERALKHADSTSGGQGLKEGLQLTIDDFVNVFKKFGVKAISALGEKFDPNFHEAVMQREDPDIDDNTVLEVIQRGYLLNDRLLRPSMVVVSKRPA
ncbi:MAG: nucleotide exchange factor GrpE [Thermodesulfobacteriota bacterium]|nr:nucleotide exchange factor GrpE [Thermodesulfobacteriota bacterium]